MHIQSNRAFQRVAALLVLPTVMVVSGLLFNSCRHEPEHNGKSNGQETPTVTRDFVIESTFVHSPSLTPYQGKINIKDETGGTTSLEEQGVIAKLQTALDMIGETSQTNAATRNSFYNVLPFTIIVNNSEDELVVKDNKTLHAGITYLQNSTINQIGSRLLQRVGAMSSMGMMAPSNGIRLAEVPVWRKCLIPGTWHPVPGTV